MKRIYKAINEGLTSSLINFSDDETFKKTDQKNKNIKRFKLGDYVLYDEKLGYNTLIGTKVAVCVSDMPGKELYAVLDHPLSMLFKEWAHRGSKLYGSRVPDYGTGWENTLYILNNFYDLDDTIWDILRDNEYVPSVEEMEIIYNNCKGTDIWETLNLSEFWYLTSTLHPRLSNNIVGFYLKNGKTDNADKEGAGRTIILLHIK